SVPRPVLMNRIVPGIGRLPGCRPVQGLTGPPSTSSLPVTVPPEDAGRVGGAALTAATPTAASAAADTTTPATWFTCLAMMPPLFAARTAIPAPGGTARRHRRAARRVDHRRPTDPAAAGSPAPCGCPSVPFRRQPFDAIPAVPVPRGMLRELVSRLLESDEP